ncbi:MAG: UDP-N-acetylmuramoyl-L-alanyl-D-glutamate--2,6-diaminopimelate ligase [Lachnospiraceae bacterium]|nr:UDP-N-acetylmuramoyl-L-alanyl-D-glutamate--2,6-diaminopimelate ligase [Lachnospiraceae bacterium]
MKLKELYPCEYDVEISKISDDSRTKGENILFVAVKGLTVDGHTYAKSAVANGAVAIVCEHEIEGVDVPQVIVKDSQRAMNEILNRFYGAPLGQLTMIGVTGTDGKTTTSEMMYQILNMMGYKTGYIGTNGIRSENYTQENDYTTPLQEELFQALDGFQEDKCEYVSMEATGERLGTGKMDGVSFDASIFTNLTRDALDLFGTMEKYGEAKAKLMEYTKSEGICVINADDPYAHIFIEHAGAPVLTYAINEKADIYATDVNVTYNFLEFTLNGKLGKHHVVCNLSGIFNVYNLMAVIGCLSHFDIATADIVKYVAKLSPVEARQTVVDCGQPFKVIVDYAHTANAVKNLVEYIKDTLTDGKVKVVVGAGGSRDVYRRTDMAEYCTATADYNYFTIEDARFEDPQMLVDTMVATVPDATNYELIVDRDEAITKAIKDAEPGDTILILGKGAERYMMTMGELVERPNDIERAYMVLEEMGYKKQS